MSEIVKLHFILFFMSIYFILNNGQLSDLKEDKFVFKQIQ